VTPDASIYEKQQRRKVWQAVLLQDTFLTVLLSLPPSATHTDVNVDELEDDSSSIAHSNPTDTAYIRGSWTLANIVQETICSPRSLDMPICTTARHKSKLVADFRAVYRSFPDIFRSWDNDSLRQLAQTNKRVVRQTLFLTSNYFHNLMLVHASESPDVPVNVRGTLEAAHDAIMSFFMLFDLFEMEARVWWVFNHRAFLEALCIGGVLTEALREPNGHETVARDPLFVRAKADICESRPFPRHIGKTFVADHCPRRSTYDADYADDERGRTRLKRCKDTGPGPERVPVGNKYLAIWASLSKKECADDTPPACDREARRRRSISLVHSLGSRSRCVNVGIVFPVFQKLCEIKRTKNLA